MGAAAAEVREAMRQEIEAAFEETEERKGEVLARSAEAKERPAAIDPGPPRHAAVAIPSLLNEVAEPFHWLKPYAAVIE